jgi:spore coat polysaccharide biosynthesis protein SpsF
MATPPLPGKALLPLAGAPLLERMVQRVLSASSDFQLVVATSTRQEDDALRELCRCIDVKCAGGHPTDLLDRVFHIACDERADEVGLIPLSSPLIDPATVDAVVQFSTRDDRAFDYVSNLHPASYPAGNDVELLPFAVLETAWKEARREYERTYITPYCWDNPGRFRIGNVQWADGPNGSMSHRWCLEFPEDYLFVRAVFDELWSVRRPVFPLRDILRLTMARPDLSGINSHLAGVNWYRHHLHELKTISETDTRRLPSSPDQQIRAL